MFENGGQLKVFVVNAILQRMESNNRSETAARAGAPAAAIGN